MASTPVSSSASQPNLLRHYTPTVTDCSSSASSIPVVDLSAQKTRVVQALVKACEDYGFFKVVNHGISQALIDAMEAEAEKLFALPLSEKERAGPADPYGYGNRSIGRNGDVGWIEYLLFRSDFQYVQQRYKAISPDNYINFCNTASKYISATKKLACDILELLAEGLGLPENIFSSFLTAEGSDSAFRLNHYPPCPDPSNIIGFGEHTDPQILTVLHSNDVGGLQVLSRDGKWVTVSPDPSSFSINIGDCMQGKRVVSYGPRLWNYWRGVALVVFLFLLMMIAVASEPDTSNSTGENVPVGDRLPPNCHIVGNCGECLCQTIGGYLYCCDA